VAAFPAVISASSVSIWFFVVIIIASGPALVKSRHFASLTFADRQTHHTAQPFITQNCPCGSGKKYKNCCLDKDNAATK
jgi:hypothetical protein